MRSLSSSMWLKSNSSDNRFANILYNLKNSKIIEINLK
jgi:hypothetical protein